LAFLLQHQSRLFLLKSAIVKDSNPNSYPLALIIDDEMDICYLLSSLLREKKLSTQSVFDLAQAKSVLNDIKPDIIFLDNHLTDGLGLDFIPWIKQVSPASKLIMITAYDDPASKHQAFARGVDDFISKPLRRDIISSTVERLLHLAPATV
jgi:two-component system, OmpR family, response regulator